MYKDLISYQLADKVTIEQLKAIGGEIVESWMRKQPGFIKWEINSNADGSYTDIVTWESKEAADKATAEMANIPNAGRWYACYKEGTIASVKLTHIAEF